MKYVDNVPTCDYPECLATGHLERINAKGRKGNFFCEEHYSLLRRDNRSTWILDSTKMLWGSKFHEIVTVTDDQLAAYFASEMTNMGFVVNMICPTGEIVSL